jgi:hypothetical protein
MLLERLHRFDPKTQTTLLGLMTSRESTCTAPPVDPKPKLRPKRVGDCKDLTQNRNLRSSPTSLGRPDPNENLRFWHGDGDSRESSSSSCFCCCSFDTLQSLATLRFLHPARGRLCCRPPPRAAAAASWDARRPSRSRAGTYHRRAHDEGSIRSLTV